MHRSFPLALTLAAALPLALAGCGGDKPKSAPAPRPSATTPPTIEQIAASIGCPPQQRGKAADYRQAVCRGGSGSFVITTFASDKAQQDWLEYSTMYGGSYLVGNRWIVISTTERLQALRPRLGGQLQQG